MTKALAYRLFDYDLWANTQMLEALDAQAPLSPSSPTARLFSHIIAAQQIWLRRVRGDAPIDYTVWPEMDPSSWKDALHETHAAWRDQLEAAEAGYSVPVVYRNSRGESFETPLHEIITHVAIHGQHHRAQIALDLRAAGHVPPTTDFIFFTRATQSQR